MKQTHVNRQIIILNTFSNFPLVVLGGTDVIVLATTPNVRGFKPGQERQTFGR